jgi:hypothetical protein
VTHHYLNKFLYLELKRYSLSFVLVPFHSKPNMEMPPDPLYNWFVQNITLANQHLLGPLQNGMCRVSARLISPGDSVCDSHPDTNKGFDIPFRMYSEQALRFIGFDETQSRELLQAWLNLSADCCAHWSFEEFIFACLSETMCITVHADWRREMRRIGVSSELQEGILDPEFEDVRATGSLSHWVHHFIEENFLVLSVSRTACPLALKRWSQGLESYRTDPNPSTILHALAIRRCTKPLPPLGSLKYSSPPPWVPVQYRCKTSARRTSRTTSPTSDTSATGVVNPGSLRISLRTPGEIARSQMTSRSSGCCVQRTKLRVIRSGIKSLAMIGRN